MDNYIPARGDVVWIDMNPQAGHEQAGRRPAVVLSPSAYNSKIGLALSCLPNGIPPCGPPSEDYTGRAYSSGVTGKQKKTNSLRPLRLCGDYKLSNYNTIPYLRIRVLSWGFTDDYYFELFGTYNIQVFKIFTIKAPIPGYKLICLYFGMSTDQEITHNVLAIRNGFIAGKTDSLLMITASGADNHTFLAGSVFFPGTAGFEKRFFI